MPVFNIVINNSAKILTELHFYEIRHLTDKYSSLYYTVLYYNIFPDAFIGCLHKKKAIIKPVKGYFTTSTRNRYFKCGWTKCEPYGTLHRFELRTLLKRTEVKACSTRNILFLGFRVWMLGTATNSSLSIRLTCSNSFCRHRIKQVQRPLLIMHP